MQPRLVRSRTDKIIAGVCGGLGDYFSVDPVIVRLIFVLVTLTSGAGLPIYILLWILMPRSSAPWPGYDQSYTAYSQQAQPSAFEPAQTEREQELHEVVRSRAPQPVQQRAARRGPFTRTQVPPAPGEYRFDPQTGQSLDPHFPSTGETVNLRTGWQEAPSEFTVPPEASQGPMYANPAPRRRSWRTLGFILLGIGGLILLEQLGLNTALLFPVLLILAGIVLLKRRT